MRYSRHNFAVRHAASPHPNVPEFYRVQLEQDGSSVAADGHIVLAVGPADPERAESFPPNDHPNVSPPPDGVGIDPKLAATIERGMPPGNKHPSLQYAQLTRCDELRVELMTTNAVRYSRHGEPPARRKFTDWRKAVRAVRSRASKGRVVLDLKGMLRALNAINEATRDLGKSVPLFVEFGDDDDVLVMRTHNYVSNQRVLGVIKPMKLPEDMDWLEPDDWERLIGAPRRRRPRRLKDGQAHGDSGGGGDSSGSAASTDPGESCGGGGPTEAARTRRPRLRRRRRRHAP